MVTTFTYALITLWVFTHCDGLTEDALINRDKNWYRECLKDDDCRSLGASCIDGNCQTGLRTKRAYDEIVTDCPEELTVLVHHKLQGVQWNDAFARKESEEYNALKSQMQSYVEKEDIAFLSKILSIVFERSGVEVLVHIRLLLAPPRTFVKHIRSDELLDQEEDQLMSKLGLDGLRDSSNAEGSVQIHRDTHPKIGEACDSDILCSVINTECSKDGVCECTGEYREIPGTIDQCYKDLNRDCATNVDCETTGASCIHGRCWIGSIRRRFKRRYDEIHTDCKEGITILITQSLRGMPWDDNLKMKDSDEYRELYSLLESYIEAARMPYMKKLLSIVFEKADEGILAHIRFLMALTNRSKRHIDQLEEKLNHEETVRQLHIERKLQRTAEALQLHVAATRINIIQDGQSE